MRNDIERTVDTVLSGLTVDASRQEQLLRCALQARQAAPARKPKLTFQFSPSHRLVAALLVVLLLLLPLLKPETDPYYRYSSEDGQDYFVTNNSDVTPSTDAVAAPGELEDAYYQGTSIEEATAVFGKPIPQLTWLPESIKLELVDACTSPATRIADFLYKDPYILFSVMDYFTGEFGNLWFPQDEEGEYQTLANGQNIYITTNYGRLTIIWQQGFTIYSLSTEASLEDAIRMIESIR